MKSRPLWRVVKTHLSSDAINTDFRFYLLPWICDRARRDLRFQPNRADASARISRAAAFAQRRSSPQAIHWLIRQKSTGGAAPIWATRCTRLEVYLVARCSASCGDRSSRVAATGRVLLPAFLRIPGYALRCIFAHNVSSTRSWTRCPPRMSGERPLDPPSKGIRGAPS